MNPVQVPCPSPGASHRFATRIRIDSEEGGKAEWAAREVPEQAKAYPEARMFGRLPAYGLYCRHVKGLRLRQVEFRAVPAEARPALVCDDVQDVEIAGLRGAEISGAQPTLRFLQTRQAFLHSCLAPTGAKTFLEVGGDRTVHVALVNCDLSGAEKAVEVRRRTRGPMPYFANAGTQRISVRVISEPSCLSWPLEGQKTRVLIVPR